VSLSVDVGAGEVSLIYEDSAPRRDPFAGAPRIDESATVEGPMRFKALRISFRAGLSRTERTKDRSRYHEARLEPSPSRALP
jgi:hypothetical protein